MRNESCNIQKIDKSKLIVISLCLGACRFVIELIKFNVWFQRIVYPNESTENATVAIVHYVLAFEASNILLISGMNLTPHNGRNGDQRK